MQPKYLFDRKSDVNLSCSAEYRRTLSNLKGQAIGLLTEQFTKWISLIFPPVPSPSHIHPHNFFFLIGFEFQHFVRSSILFVSSFEKFYIWLCANLFTLAVPFILFVMCGQLHCTPLCLEEKREEIYSCGLWYSTISSLFWMGFIFFSFRQLQYRCLHLRYSSLSLFMVYGKKKVL